MSFAHGVSSWRWDCSLWFSYASMPFDNIKTRLQSTGHNYSGMVNCAVRTLREEGVTAFWRGSTPRLARLIVRVLLLLRDLQANLNSCPVASPLLSSTRSSALYKPSKVRTWLPRASCDVRNHPTRDFFAPRISLKYFHGIRIFHNSLYRCIPYIDI